jgi:hypothetical protein
MKQEPRVTGIAQCPNCEHIQALYTPKTRGAFYQCSRCELPPKPGAAPTREPLRPRMRVRWLETDMPESLWKTYFKESQLL